MRKFIIDRYNAEDVIEVNVEEIPGPYDDGDPVWVDKNHINDYGFFVEQDLYDSEEEALEVFLAEICEDQRHLDSLEKKILDRLFPEDANSPRACA
jgi:hypothetical protein